MELQDIVAGSATDMYCTSRVKCFINRGVSCDLLHLQHAEAHFLFLSEQSSAEDWNLGASLGLGLCLYEYRKLYTARLLA